MIKGNPALRHGGEKRMADIILRGNVRGKERDEGERGEKKRGGEPVSHLSRVKKKENPTEKLTAPREEEEGSLTEKKRKEKLPTLPEGGPSGKHPTTGERGRKYRMRFLTSRSRNRTEGGYYRCPLLEGRETIFWWINIKGERRKGNERGHPWCGGRKKECGQPLPQKTVISRKKKREGFRLCI